MARQTSPPEQQSVRVLKVGERVRHILSELLARGEAHDETLTAHAVSVTEVRMTPDLRHAVAYVKPLLGEGAAYAFGIALLASGLSSSTVGTMAGQMIVDGFMQWKVSVFLRRFITMIPALVVIALGANVLSTLVASQVVLSLVLPFAVIPLVWLTRRRDVMGDMANGRILHGLAVLVSCLVIAMNVVLLAVTVLG